MAAACPVPPPPTWPPPLPSNYYYYYFVVVNNYYGSITSSIVQAVSPLTVVTAGEPIWNRTSQTNVMVTFSDGLDPVTAATVGNYSLNLGATISSATVVATNEVALVTSPLAGSYTLTVSNVKDFSRRHDVTFLN